MTNGELSRLSIVCPPACTHLYPNFQTLHILHILFCSCCTYGTSCTYFQTECCVPPCVHSPIPKLSNAAHLAHIFIYCPNCICNIVHIVHVSYIAHIFQTERCVPPTCTQYTHTFKFCTYCTYYHILHMQYCTYCTGCIYCTYFEN